MENAENAIGDAWHWPALHDGQRLVLRDVLLHGSKSRADLARRAGLSRTSLTRLTRDLVDMGFLAEGVVRPSSGRGRPSEMLDLLPRSAYFAGFKLTGDALYAVVTDLRAQVVERIERPLPPSRAIADVVAMIAAIVAEERSRIPRVCALGICLAGDVEIVDDRAEVVASGFLGWDRAPLESLLLEATGLPVAVSNDVQALTVGHHWFGAGVGRTSLALTSFGAGVGTGLVVHDELVRGARGHSGRLDHLRFDRGEGDPVCELGHQGCVSAWATEKFFVPNAGASDFKEALALARGGDRRAVWAVDGLARAIGVLVAETTNLLDPERIIVTGEGLPALRAGEAAFRQAIRERLDRTVEMPSVVLWDFEFSDYAWASAITAIREVVQPVEPVRVLQVDV